jgi:hypothetical protein
MPHSLTGTLDFAFGACQAAIVKEAQGYISILSRWVADLPILLLGGISPFISLVQVQSASQYKLPRNRPSYLHLSLALTATHRWFS